jgi:hypothetical protein
LKVHKEILMSLITSLNPASTAPVTVNSHVRDRKHDGPFGSTEAQEGPVHSLFGSLLQTAEKLAGLQSAPVSAVVAAGAAALSDKR